MSENDMFELKKSKINNRRICQLGDVPTQGLGTSLNKKSSLADVLGTEVGLEYFQRFTETESSDENIRFLIEAHLFHEKWTAALMEMQNEAQGIYDKYIDVKAPSGVNLSARVRKPMHDNLKEGKTKDMLQSLIQCKKEVMDMVERDSLIRFKSHALWDDCVRDASVAKVLKLKDAPVDVYVKGGMIINETAGRSFSIKVIVKRMNRKTDTLRTSSCGAKKCSWFEQLKFKDARLDEDLNLELIGGKLIDRVVGYASISLRDFQRSGKLRQSYTLEFYKEKEQKKKIGVQADIDVAYNLQFLDALRNVDEVYETA